MNKGETLNMNCTQPHPHPKPHPNTELIRWEEIFWEDSSKWKELTK